MKKIVILFFAILTLSACSTKFAYKNIDWLIYWYVDDYIEFTDEQEIIFDQKLQAWIAWHKSSELPQYLAHIDELIQDIEQQSLSIDRMQYHQDKAREHWVRLRSHVAPDIVEMSKRLDDKQLVYLFAALEKDNQEDFEEIQERENKSPEKRRKDWISRNQENSEQWLGRLTKEQKDFIANNYGNFQSTSQHWLAYKRDYQKVLRALLVNRAKEERYEEKLLDLLVNPEQFRPQAFINALDANAALGKQYMMTLLTLSTEKQQKELIEQINNYRDDIVDLMN